MRGFLQVQSGLVWSAITAAGLGLIGCSDHDPDPYQPLTEACDACLLRTGSDGCGDAYEACEELESCEPVVLCELGQQCYTEPESSGCSRTRGCESGADSKELEAAAEFEACARSVCAESCSFME